jgi:dTDP-4-dehydrorhamnose reductase
MKALVIGGTGQVGTELRRVMWPSAAQTITPSRGELDLADRKSINNFFDGHRFDVVINSGAYTAVDAAEQNPSDAFAVNAMGACAVAECAHRLDIPLVHVSTDYVFDGLKPMPYEEDDPVRPIGVYGASKAAGEFAVSLANRRSVIVRTAWVVSPHGSNFVKTMLSHAAKRPLLRVVADQRGSPTAAADLAGALAAIAVRLVQDGHSPTGIYHFANAGETTWHGLAEAAVNRAATRGSACPPIQAIATSDFPTRANRPANSRLATSKIGRDFGIVPRPWMAAVNEIVDELLAKDKA